MSRIQWRAHPPQRGVATLKLASTVLTTCAVVACAGLACAGPARVASRTPTPVDSAAAQALGRESRTRIQRGAIGVPPFAAAGADSSLVPLAYALADLVATDLSRSARVRVVERARLGDVLRELDLSASGRVDSATAPRVGKLVSAERLIFGAIEPMGDGRNIRLGARIGDVVSGEVMTAVDARAPLAEIFAAEKALVLRLFEQMGVTLTPQELARVEQQPTRSIGALLAYGRGVQKSYEGDYRGASQAFRDSYRLDPKFTGARSREMDARAIDASGTSLPVGVPGVRPLDAAISTTVDRLNRPLDLVTTVNRAVSTSADPGFPSTQATIVITISRP